MTSTDRSYQTKPDRCPCPPATGQRIASPSPERAIARSGTIPPYRWTDTHQWQEHILIVADAASADTVWEWSRGAATTCIGGLASWAETDWSILLAEGVQKVTLLPNATASREATTAFHQLAEHLVRIGIDAVRIVRLPQRCGPDWSVASSTADEVRELATKNVSLLNCPSKPPKMWPVRIDGENQQVAVIRWHEWMHNMDGRRARWHGVLADGHGRVAWPRRRSPDFRERLALYRSCDWVDADPSQPLFVCESEADADALIETGLAATCWCYPSWPRNPRIYGPLADRDIVIVHGEEPTGRAWADTVRIAIGTHGQRAMPRSLKRLPLAQSVRTADRLTGTVVTWLAAGGDADELLELAGFGPSVNEAISNTSGVTIHGPLDQARPQDEGKDEKAMATPEIDRYTHTNPASADHPSATTALEQLAASGRIKGKIRWDADRRGFMACCPCHHDRTPSLHVQVKQDRIVWHCHADCSQEVVGRALGLWQDKPPPQANGQTAGSDCVNLSQPDHTWTYHGTKGSTFQVHRIDARPGQDKRVWQSPKGVKLQDGELWKAYVQGDPEDCLLDLIVEGERTADKARAALPEMRVITCQRSVDKTDWSLCKGRTVLIWPDNDGPGFKKAEAIARAVQAAGARAVKVVQAGGKWKDDAADFVDRGESLAAVIENRSWELDDRGLALRPIVLISDQGLMCCLRHLDLIPRFNVRSQRVEMISRKANNAACIPQRTWTAINKRITSAASEAIRRDFVKVKLGQNGGNGERKKELVPAIFGRERWDTCFHAVLASREVDPFKKYLKKLEPKSSENLDTWIPDLFDVSETAKPLIKWASRFLLLGAVQRTFEPGCKLDEVPVFVGKQGLGKSAIGLAILPSAFRHEGHGDGLVLAGDPKHFAEALQGKIIVEASEMAGMGKADLERLKANMTRTNDGAVRLAYRADPEPLPRRAVFYGTSNDAECLPNDSTGNRRFVVIELLGTEARMAVEKYFDEHRDELWRAAVHAYKQGERANLPRDLFPAQAEVNEQFRSKDIVIEDQLAAATFDQRADDPGLTIREITHVMFTDSSEADRMVASRGWGHRLGKVLRLHGWERKQRRADGGKPQWRWTRPASPMSPTPEIGDETNSLIEKDFW